jgi:PAS domain S-box-containing protein
MKSYSVELLGSLIDNVTEGILVCSDDNKIQYANKSAEELFGYESDFLIGKDLFILIPQRFRHNHDQHVEKYFEKPANRKMGIGKSLYGLRRSGEEFPLEISLSYFHHDGSSFVFAFVVDITERKAIDIQLIEKNSSLEKMTEELAKLTSELESKVHERTMILREALEELEKSQKELSDSLSKEKELNEIKSRFVSMASHEFRTPLSTILSSASLILKYPNTEEQLNRDRHVKKIKEAVKHLNEILEDFLSIGKLEEGKLGIKIETFDLSNFIYEIIEEIKTILKPGQDIKYIISGSGSFVTDKRILKNILINLLSNATKFSYENSPIRLIIDSNESLKIQVIDQGIGIAQEDISHLFTNFFRGKNATNIQGTGLGLPIIKRYLNLIKGSIKVESELNKGSTFIIELEKLKTNIESEN